MWVDLTNVSDTTNSLRFSFIVAPTSEFVSADILVRSPQKLFFYCPKIVFVVSKYPKNIPLNFEKNISAHNNSYGLELWRHVQYVLFFCVTLDLA